jgi:hypothetical protein
VIHPNFHQNLFVANAVSFDFSKYFFDFILLDPYHFTDSDLIRLLQNLIERISNSIILYTYADVLIENKLKSVADFPALKSISNLKIFNYHEISFAIYRSV